MRILIANSDGITLGGIETYLNSVVPRLLELGHEVGLMWEIPPSAESARGRSVHPRLTVSTAPLSLSQIDAWRPDVVYSQGLSDVRLESAVVQSHPTVLYAHAYHGTCISGAKCHSHREHDTCRRTLGPMCLAYYFPYGCGGNNPLTMWRLYREQRARLATLSGYRAVLVASRHMEDEFRRHGIEDRLHLLKLFPTETTPDAEPPQPRPWTNRVLFVGRTVPLKGTLHLPEAVVAAARQLGRRLTLVVAGRGVESEALQQSAEAHGVPLEMLGVVDAKRRTSEMRNSDLLLVPSLWPEPFGLVGIEGGCVGLPTAGYCVGGIADWLLPGVTGEATSETEKTPAHLAQAIVRAIGTESHWNALRLGAWNFAQTYGLDEHMRGLSTILDAAANKN